MALQFPRQEYASRLAAARQLLYHDGFAALLVFAQESHYYLTGYDTTGYVWFQCGILMAK